MRRTDDGLQLGLALLLSMVCHGPLLLVFSLVLQNQGGEMAIARFDPITELRVDLVEETKPPPRDEQEKLTFVSQPQPEIEERPETARFADRYDSVAARETVKKSAPAKTPQRIEQPKVQQKKRPPREMPKVPREQAASDIRPNTPDDDSGSQATKLLDSSTDSDRALDRSRQTETQETADLLFPNFRTAGAANLNGHDSIDYLRDVAEGDKTLLNRKKSRYWSFFDRIKVDIAKQWSPVTEYRKRDPNGNVYGVKDRYSTVRVTLNGNGSVRSLVVARDSGLEFFDAEAIRSIRAASPFHNPPEGLKDQDGLVHFTFGFYFEITSGQFRFRRMRR
jgi:TonB family protein